MLGQFQVQHFGKIAKLRTDLDAHTALQAVGVHGSTSAATANKLMHRDANGRAQVADPSVASDIATMGWVQNQLSGAGLGTVTSVGTGTGLTGGPITGSGTIALADTAVTPGTYAYATISVDQQGRLTAASAGAPVTSVGVTSPITKGGTPAAPTIGIQAASASQHGYMSSTDKAKLDGIAAGAQANAVSSVFGRTGGITANAGDYTIQKIGGFTVSTSGPSGGANGDVWLQV